MNERARFWRHSRRNPNLVFYDDCSNQIIEPEFEVLYIPHSIYDLITVFKEIDDWVLQYSTTLKTKSDTIRIPKILFAGGNELHSKRWTYLNCGKVCNGKETDFYENGNKRTEGTYENGKPIEIKEYRNGNLIGITRRDLQLLVLPCPPQIPPVLNPASQNEGTTEFDVNEGDVLCFPIIFSDEEGFC